MSQEKPTNLEPRVAKLETGLEILTRDVTTLATVVREQSRNIEAEIQNLAVAVTQAAGPKKTDWSLFIGFIMLILTIGSAVFWPINQTAESNKTAIHELGSLVASHVALDSHPVANVILKSLEDKVNRDFVQINARLNKLESINDERNKSDIEELREIKKKVIGYHMGPFPIISTNR